MSTHPELGELPPSPEVQRSMALFQIKSFQTLNSDYRQVTEMVNNHPSTKNLQKLAKVSNEIQDSADPLVETMFFRDIDPALVGKTAEVLLGEINKNRGLAAAIEGDTDYEDDFDEEFRQQLIDRILSDEAEEEDESEIIILTSDPLDLSPRSLAKFMGGVYGMSVQDLFESLENSESVCTGLDEEYARREHMRTAAMGLIAFAGAFAGSLLANKVKNR